jgi:hypothetical protein
MIDRPITDPAVAAFFAAVAPAMRPRLLAARAAILAAAPDLDESLKWGESSYRRLRVGKAVRLNHFGDSITLLFHCRTTIVGRIRERHGDALRYDGNRAVFLAAAQADDRALIGDLAQQAFGYRG